MKVSNRQRRILEVLLNRHGEVTAGQLAEELQISARTVHRELQELEPVVLSHGMSLVKKSGIGISLEGPEQAALRFREQLGRSETETFSPDERKALMLCRLLEEEEPVKLFALAREAQAAIPTVSRDLDELEPQLNRSGLDLIRKRGYGIEIAGAESAKRQFIVRMAEDYLDESDWFGSPGDRSEQWPVSRRLLGLAGRDTFLQIEQSLWQLAEEWLKGLQEADYTRLLVRLSVAVTRIRRLRFVKEDQTSFAGGLSRAGASRFSQLAGFLRNLDLSGLPAAEMEYLQNLFDEAREKTADVSSVILEKYGLELAERTMGLIRSVEIRMDTPLSKDRSLLDGLIRHLGPALQRLRRGESIRNPLLPQIKKDDVRLFQAVRESASAAWPDIAVPDEEAGFLTMHFGAALERWKLTPGNVKALLVCTSGIGSSKLLAVRISKEIPQIDLIGHYSWYEASHMPEDQYDLIISTVDLPVEPERYIKLSPLLTREETEKLRAHIREIAAVPRRSTTAGRSDDRGAWGRLITMSAHAPVVVRLLESFRVFDIDNEKENRDVRLLLRRMLDKASEWIPLKEPDSIVLQLIEREKQGSLRIPETELALYHTRSDGIREPLLALFRLKVSQPGADAPDAWIRQIMLMLAPRTLSKQALEVLSEISALLLEKELIRLLESGEEESIRAFLAGRLETYIRDKMDWRDAE